MEIKTARNWYWWLWLSPGLTLPTLVIILWDGLWYGTTTPSQIITAVLVSSAWHLVLLKPALDPDSRFIRWHGRQALALAGLRTLIAFLAALFSETFLAPILIIVLVIVWFFGTLVFQIQAGRGNCTLWRWLGNQDEPLLVKKEADFPDWMGEGKEVEVLDIDRLVEIIRFSRDRDQRQAALMELRRLGLVEVMEGEEEEPAWEAGPPPGRPMAAPPEKRTEGPRPYFSGEEAEPRQKSPIRWGCLILAVLASICLIIYILLDTSMRPGAYRYSLPTRTSVATQPTRVPPPLSPTQENIPRAQELVDGLWDLTYQGRIEEALQDLEEAQRLDPDLWISSQVWNDLCWFGSLNGYPEEVFEACETAVALQPGSAGYRDSRGLTRALLGDYQGAIEDFEVFVKWATVSAEDESYAAKRQAWIEDLENGINPFDEETLVALKTK